MDNKLTEIPLQALFLFRSHRKKPHLFPWDLMLVEAGAEGVVYSGHMENGRRGLGVKLLVSGWSRLAGFCGMEIQEKRNGGSQQKEGAQKQ